MNCISFRFMYEDSCCLMQGPLQLKNDFISCLHNLYWVVSAQNILEKYSSISLLKGEIHLCLSSKWQIWDSNIHQASYITNAKANYCLISKLLLSISQFSGKLGWLLSHDNAFTLQHLFLYVLQPLTLFQPRPVCQLQAKPTNNINKYTERSATPTIYWFWPITGSLVLCPWLFSAWQQSKTFWSQWLNRFCDQVHVHVNVVIKCIVAKYSSTAIWWDCAAWCFVLIMKKYVD